MVRALLKQPKITILNGVGDTASEEDEHLRNVIDNSVGEGTLIVGLSRLELAAGYPSILRLKDGQLIAQGSYEEVKKADEG